MSAKTECTICCSNVTQRNIVKCPDTSCTDAICVECTKRYLIEMTRPDDDPHCMLCKHGFSRDVMSGIFTGVWLNGEYKRHMKTVLLERERALLTQSQAEAERLLASEKARSSVIEYRVSVSTQLGDNMAERRELISEYHNGRLSLAELEDQYKIVVVKVAEVEGVQRYMNANAAMLEALVKPSVTADRQKFTRKCPNSDCGGFLSTHWKCGLCETKVCHQCFAIYVGTHAEHECNEDDAKSAELIKQDTKPCPSCGARIFKIMGCNQMFCTACNVAFCWKTGNILNTARVHNPHFFEYMVQREGGADERAVGDVTCGGFQMPHEVPAELRNCLMSINEIVDIHQPMYRRQGNNSEFNRLRVQFLMKKISEPLWKNAIFKLH
jgi:hypothetical protein